MVTVPLDPVPVDENTDAVKFPLVLEGWNWNVAVTGVPVKATSPFGSVNENE